MAATPPHTPWARLDLPGGACLPLEGPCPSCVTYPPEPACEVCKGIGRVLTPTGRSLLDLLDRYGVLLLPPPKATTASRRPVSDAQTRELQRLLDLCGRHGIGVQARPPRFQDEADSMEAQLREKLKEKGVVAAGVLLP